MPAEIRPEDVESIVVWNLVRAARVAERALRVRLERYRLTPVQFGVLVYLASDGPATQAALARLVLVRPQSLAAAVDELTGRALVQRGAGRGRGRRNHLDLTDQGRELTQRAYDDVQAGQVDGDPRALVELNAHLLRIVHGEASGDPDASLS